MSKIIFPLRALTQLVNVTSSHGTAQGNSDKIRVWNVFSGNFRSFLFLFRCWKTIFAPINRAHTFKHSFRSHNIWNNTTMTKKGELYIRKSFRKCVGSLYIIIATFFSFFWCHQNWIRIKNLHSILRNVLDRRWKF